MGQNKRKKSSPATSASSNAKRTRRKTTSASTKASKASKKPSQETSQVEQKKEEIPSSMPIVILDTGGWTIKHGTVSPRDLQGPEKASTANAKLNHPDASTNDLNIDAFFYNETPNLTARLKHQLAVLVGDEIHTVKNKAQLQLNHPLERGYCTDFACQLEVWRRVLQREYEIHHSPQQYPSKFNSVKKKNSKPVNAHFPESIPQCAFLLTQPFTPTTLSDRIDEILFLDLGFQRVSKRLIQCMSAHHYLQTTKDTSSCCLVVDSGFSMTHIVPTIDAKAVVSTTSFPLLFLL